jgi:hypothetical protein
MSAKPPKIDRVDRKGSYLFESCPRLAFFEALDALRPQWHPPQDKPEDKYRSQCRSKNQSRTSLCPSYFFLALRGYRPPDKHRHNPQSPRKHWSLWYEPLHFLPLNVLNPNIAQWLLYQRSPTVPKKCTRKPNGGNAFDTYACIASAVLPSFANTSELSKSRSIIRET